jgi:hypothetical protein
MPNRSARFWRLSNSGSITDVLVVTVGGGVDGVGGLGLVTGCCLCSMTAGVGSTFQSRL